MPSTVHLTKTTVWTAGALIWVLPDFKHSHWLPQIDWYLNFVLKRALSRTHPPLAPQLQAIIRAQKWEMPRLRCDSTVPVLVSSQQRLPNKYTLVMPFQGDFESWIKQVIQSADKLQVQTLRIFLPGGFSVEDFAAYLNLFDEAKIIELVSDDSAA